jgi:GTP pyrophosphokinase
MMKSKASQKTQKNKAHVKEPVRIRTFIKKLQENNPNIDSERIRRAYDYLKTSVRGQEKEPADDCINDALESAEILAEINADEETIIAALISHPAIHGYCTGKEIQEHFGDEVHMLIKNMTRTSKIKFRSRFEEQAENFRKMILAMAQDLRVVLLNLSQRLQLMRHLNRLDSAAQREIAQESLEIYAPLANRLGIARIKWEMEDLCLKFLHSSIYEELEERVPQDREQRKAYIAKVIRFIKKEMKAQGISGEVVGRAKHFFSIYQKIVKRGVNFDEIFDLIALRIITDTTSHCYAILGLIHSLWKPVPGRFKDYIGVPKTNMYQSLHTIVIGPDGQKVEFQIRTEEMHRIAEQGIAAHWKYKEGVKSSPSLEQKFAWLRQLLEWQKELKSPQEFMESVKTDLFEESVYIFTPAGEVKELPSGSTPLDFAYSIHSDVGNHCVGAKVDNRMVPLKTLLKTGDKIEILTSKNQTPSKDWLKLVKSTKARNRIRHYLNQEEQKQSFTIGHELLEKEARKHDLTLSKILKSDEIHEVVGELGFSQLDKLIASVGFGKLTAGHVLSRFIPAEVGPEPGVIKTRKPHKKSKDGIKIHGFGDILVHFSRCCNPVPGDEVVGFITRGQGVSIHRISCSNVGGGAIDSDRIVNVEWDLKEESVRPVKISVMTTNRPGVLANISAKISSENINISAADIRTRRDGHTVCTFELEIRNREDLDRIMQTLSQTKEVLEVKRTTDT